jgi:hypothetical protein
MSGFSYTNTESKFSGGKRIVRRVSIKNGKGYKSVSIKHRGKANKTVRRRICSDDMYKIQNGVFIPGLFRDCRKFRKTGATRM